jgi:hypothetical protein
MQDLFVTIDTTAPATPTGLDLQDASDSLFAVTDATGTHTFGSAADNYTNARSPSFSVGSIEAGTVVALLRDGVVVATLTAPASPGGGPQTLTLTDPGPVPAGRRTYTVQQLDPAGNLTPPGAALEVVFDFSLPAVPSAPRLLPADDSGTPGDDVTNVPRPRLTGTAALAPGEIPARIHILDAGGTIIGEADVAAGGTYTVQLDLPVIPDSINFYTVRARAVDQAGNQSAPGAAYTLTIDTRSPAAPTLALSPTDDTGVVGDNITRVRRPTLIGRTGPGLFLDLILLGPPDAVLVDGRAGNIRSAGDGSFAIQVPRDLADGVYRLQVRAYDAAGNQSFSNVLTLVIDNAAPAAVPSLALRPDTDTGIKGDGRTSLRRPVLVGQAEPNATIEVIGPDGAVLNVPTQADAAGRFETQLASELVNGAIALRARVRDASGNLGAPGDPLILTIVTTLGDYDADGRADLAIFQRTTATWSVARSGLGPLTQAFGAGTDTPVQADFDGDGVTDLVVFRPETAEWLVQRSRRGFLQRPFGVPGASLPAPADYDGDGIDDFAIYVPATGVWRVESSRDGVTRETAFGPAGSLPVPADYDGDGRADLAVYLPGSGPGVASQWSILGSRDGQIRQVAFGDAAQIPVPADYDGDGLADVATYLPSPGPGVSAQWFLLGSRDGLRPVAFGGFGHIPVPRDYDGDGRTDVATFDPGTGQWFVLGSATGQITTTTFGVPSSVPVPVAAPLPYRQQVVIVTPPPLGGTTASIVPVSPNPRTAPVDSIVIAFNRPVAGFDLADLRLTRDGVAVPLAGATLTSGDNQTWTLGNLAGLTGAAGAYALTLVAAGSGIQGAGAGPLAADAGAAFTVLAPAPPPPPAPADTTGPTVAGLLTLSPRRRRTISGIVLRFSEPLDPAQAENIGNYSLLASGRDRRFGNRNDRAVPIRLATYDPATRTVTLTLARPQSRGQAYRLTVFGTTLGVSVSDPAGNLLDGDRNGIPGGDFLGRFGRPERPSLSARAVDLLTMAGDLPSVLTRNRRRP